METSDGKLLREVEITRQDEIFPTADGALKGNKIIVPGIKVSIIAVSYGWKPYSRGNLINEAGLPVSTFRIEIK